MPTSLAPRVDRRRRDPWGEEALAQARDLQPQVILIGLDRSGLISLETIFRVRNVLPGVGIIALTLLNGNAYRQAVLVTGGSMRLWGARRGGTGPVDHRR